MRNWSFLVLLSLATPFARADIVVTSTSQTLSGSGGAALSAIPPRIHITSRCPPPNPLPYNLSESGTANTASPDGQHITVGSTASQQADVTPDHIGVDMGVSVDMDGLARILGGFVGAAGTSQFTLLFNLTSPSVVHLTGEEFDEGDLFQPPVFAGNTLREDLLLSGPGGFRFEVSNFSFSFVDKQLPLAAGSYVLTAQLDNSATAGIVIVQDEFDFSDFTLSADFTPIVPEPRWGFVVPIALLLVLWSPLRAGRSIKVAE